MRGRWAAGIVPRNFAWIIKDQLAVSERPGGYAPHHRRVRRQEEILWLNAQGFTRIVSLLPSTHNLHAYEELHIPSSHFPLPVNADVRAPLSELYPALLAWLRSGERILVHQEELGERVAGVVAGFLCWSGVLPEPPRAISAVEQLLKRQLGSAGRSIVALVPELPPPGAPAPRRPDTSDAATLHPGTPAESGEDERGPDPPAVDDGAVEVAASPPATAPGGIHSPPDLSDAGASRPPAGVASTPKSAVPGSGKVGAGSGKVAAKKIPAGEAAPSAEQPPGSPEAHPAKRARTSGVRRIR